MMLENQLTIPKNANVLTICMKGLVRSPALANILQNAGYKNINYGGTYPNIVDDYHYPEDINRVTIGSSEPRKVTFGMLLWADFIISVDEEATGFMEQSYELGDHQKLIQLQVDERWSEELDRLKSLEDISAEIQEKIGPYLQD